VEGCTVIFFFSSRRRHTRCSRDWSSDVCSSDLAGVPLLRGADFVEELGEARLGAQRVGDGIHTKVHEAVVVFLVGAVKPIERSEEHTSELQSRLHLVCRLLLEKKKTKR